jgi:ubiquinone/menaquinone biosynthesis C-methylase UbiE
MNTSSAPAVNHHADHPRFAGVRGILAGLVMLVAGRGRARLAVDLASLSDSDRLVDIGCGPGSAVRAAARRGARVIGVDPAPVMLRLARTLTRDRPAVSWSEGAAEDLPVPDGAATVVWSIATVHHWSEITAGLAEVRRVLVSGGRFVAIERHVRTGATGLASHGWTDCQVQSFAAQCRAAGFDPVRIDQRTSGRHAVWVVQAVRASGPLPR